MRTIKSKILPNIFIVLLAVLLLPVACDDMLNEPLEQRDLVEDTDYTQTEDMFQLITGSYELLYSLQWETFPLISVRGDDVNAAGDQVPLTGTDEFRYDRSFWMYNSVWLNFYDDIIKFHANMEEIEKYKEFASNPSVADQYIAEIKVMRAYELFQLTRLWGDVIIPESSDAQDIYSAPVSSREDVLQHISDEMDAAAADLPDVRPNQRTDIPGGITRHTALAVKALANLELENYQAVADATGEIIGSGLFTLHNDFYELFKIPGKLSDENLLELQYSDFGASSGEQEAYLYAFFGPNNWQPAVAGASPGWGFWEPSLKFVTFMLDRNETVRLETSVLFTNEGIDSIQAQGPAYSSLPSFVSNTTRDGDVIGKTDGTANPRAIFSSGKHYLPSNQLTPGRTGYGNNKNFIVIRYAEVLLMHAEALVSGASSSVMTADEAVNEVRARASMPAVSGVTINDVVDEKFAEFGMEWGIRFYDLVRHDMTNELNQGGRTYSPEDRFIPYPLAQLDILPQLGNNN